MESPSSILMIVSDDHAAWALHENPLGVPTPNLDRLREEGARFSNAFTPSPVCSPARACLMTGKMPSEVGIHDWLDETDPDVASRDWLKDHQTLPQSLKQAGYQTFLSGKWHLGHPGQIPPGFDQAFCMSPRMRTHYGEDVYTLNGHERTLDGNRSSLITDQAIRFLEQADSEQPFFLNVGYFATHSPYNRSMHDPATLAELPDLDFSGMPRCPTHPNAKNENGPNPEKNQESERRARWRGYAAGVAEIDKGVGRILDALKQSGQLENTLVVYTADHGCCLGHHGIWGKGNGTRPVNFYETSLRVPLLIRGPGMQAGSVHPDLHTHLDTYDFLIRAAGVNTQERFLNSKQRSILAEYGDARMIRTTEWKYIARVGPERKSLYHLANDPGECRDLADQAETESVQTSLQQQLEVLFQDCSHPDTDGLRITTLPKHNSHEPWKDRVLESSR